MIATADQPGVPFDVSTASRSLCSNGSQSTPGLVRLPHKGPDVSTSCRSFGYAPNVNDTMNSGRRALFYDHEHERHVCVCVRRFEMCHVLPMTDRSGSDARARCSGSRADAGAAVERSERIRLEPKSGQRRMRNCSGDRNRWYELPEEVGYR